jgi:cytochrome c peroxidase
MYPLARTVRPATPRTRRQWPLALASLAATLTLMACGGGTDATESPMALDSSADATAATESAQARATTQAQLVQLGRAIFTDRNLSEPAGTACAACHQPNRGFAGNNGSTAGVSQGSIPGVLGHRNAMTNSYQGLVPAFGFITEDGKTEPRGGHFWDGRVDTAALQALGPLLNPLEMNNPSKQAVVEKVAASAYADQFRRAFGANVFANTEQAFSQIGVAIAAFELGALQPFNSKYDAMVRGQTTLTPAETRGLALFQDPNRANCAGCHVMNPASGKPEDSPFSEFTYYATGVPRNPASPANANPAFFDLGLCGPDRTVPALPSDATAGVTAATLCGKFRMPTLRNVAERPAYMHNGVFRTLTEVVQFYATRQSNPRRWYGPAGVPNDLPTAYLGNLETTKAPFNRAATDGPLLTDGEVADLVAFLHTLSDGFVPGAATPVALPPARPTAPPPGVPAAPPAPR